ncbi:hypothetical protein GOODEAATRI_003737, partial [Goodea atripinnis]
HASPCPNAVLPACTALTLVSYLTCVSGIPACSFLECVLMFENDSDPSSLNSLPFPPQSVDDSTEWLPLSREASLSNPPQPHFAALLLCLVFLPPLTIFSQAVQKIVPTLLFSLPHPLHILPPPSQPLATGSGKHPMQLAPGPSIPPAWRERAALDQIGPTTIC